MSIKNRYLFAISFSMAFILLLTALLLGHLEKKQMEQQIHHRTKLLAKFADASRDYVTKILRPTLDHWIPEYIPEGKSSSFVTNEIFKRFNQEFPEYSYRQPARTPLNPTNLATPFEADIIQKFHDNRSLSVQEGYQQIQGNMFFYMAHPVIMEEKCLPCHGDPNHAPARLRDTYGQESGFNWPVGEVVSATIITVPMGVEIAAQNSRYFVLAGCTLLLFSLLSGLHHLLFKRLFSDRFASLTAIMHTMGDDFRRKERLPQETHDEFGNMAKAFNRMIDSMNESYQELERTVQERSIALQDQANAFHQTQVTMNALQHRNQLLLESLGEGVYGIDRQERLTFINPAAKSMLGWTSNELMGKPIHAIIHNAHADGCDYPSSHCPILATLTDGQPRPLIQDTFWRRNGSSFPVEYTATPILHDNHIHGVVVSFRDISQRVKMQQAHKQEVRYRQIITNLYHIAFTDDKLSTQLQEGLREILTISWLVNQSRGAIFLKDCVSEDLVLHVHQGLSTEILTRCSRIPLGFCLCGRAAQTQRFLHANANDAHHEVTFPGKEDHDHYVVPLVSEHMTLGVLTLYLDEGHPPNPREEEFLLVVGQALANMIHRRHGEETLRCQLKLLEDKMARQNQEFENHLNAMRNYQEQLVRSERMATLGNRVASISHEINTPLGMSFTAATSLTERIHALEQQRQSATLNLAGLEPFLLSAQESIQIIQSNIQCAWDLIKSFQVAAVDQTQQEKRSIVLVRYLEGVLLHLHPVLKETRQTVQLDCPPDLTITTYPGAFSQIVTHFVMNSIVHGFKNKEGEQITITITMDSGELVFVYRDNGKGMDRDVVKRVFEPFFTTQPGTDHSGLGMHVVHTLVTDLLQGTITCQSSQGEGVIFTIRIPIQADGQSGHLDG
ncbi:MAG: DUF3365 domain-containing protein [Magnetococcus sp. THC-1_WYH]